MKGLSECRLYGIVDLGYVDAENAARAAREMIEGGVDIVQLRAKGWVKERIAKLAPALLEVTEPAGVPLVMNDFPELAAGTGARGVHVGQDDLGVAEARRLAGPVRFVGKSTHSVRQAADAENEGADYIGFGPLFATPTKPDYVPVGLDAIREVERAAGVPVFCIGGIKLENLEKVVSAGARRVVIVSGLLKAERIADYARAAKKILLTGGD